MIHTYETTHRSSRASHRGRAAAVRQRRLRRDQRPRHHVPGARQPGRHHLPLRLERGALPRRHRALRHADRRPRSPRSPPRSGRRSSAWPSACASSWTTSGDTRRCRALIMREMASDRPLPEPVARVIRRNMESFTRIVGRGAGRRQHPAGRAAPDGDEHRGRCRSSWRLRRRPSGRSSARDPGDPARPRDDRGPRDRQHEAGAGEPASRAAREPAQEAVAMILPLLGLGPRCSRTRPA